MDWGLVVGKASLQASDCHLTQSSTSFAALLLVMQPEVPGQQLSLLCRTLEKVSPSHKNRFTEEFMIWVLGGFLF